MFFAHVGHSRAYVFRDEKVDIERFSLLHGDVVLLCTNGLTDVADDLRVANTLRSHRKPSDQSRALVDLATNSAPGTTSPTSSRIIESSLIAGTICPSEEMTNAGPGMWATVLRTPLSAR